MKAIALYLPQFHPIPENDSWWGKGFTEWTNVTKALPLFAGHRQPYLPTDLGFYDLRLHDSYLQQTKLAQEHRIDAFCIYHYWFGGGRRLLERPLENILNNSGSGHEFMLCWANQSWQGVWHGAEGRLLIDQRYEDILTDHIDYLLEVFQDPRYLKDDGMPVFMVFNPDEIERSNETFAVWRRKAVDAGFPGLYLIAQNADPHWDFARHGYDSYVFVPNFSKRRHDSVCVSIFEKARNRLLDALKMPTRVGYEGFCLKYLRHEGRDDRIECIIPGWDNTPRAGYKGLVLTGFEPEVFSSVVDQIIGKSLERNARYVFIKSWNEWAEGNVMEPSNLHGTRLLQAFGAVMSSRDPRA